MNQTNAAVSEPEALTLDPVYKPEKELPKPTENPFRTFLLFPYRLVKRFLTFVIDFTQFILGALSDVSTYKFILIAASLVLEAITLHQLMTGSLNPNIREWFTDTSSVSIASFDTRARLNRPTEPVKAVSVGQPPTVPWRDGLEKRDVLYEHFVATVD